MSNGKFGGAGEGCGQSDQPMNEMLAWSYCDNFQIVGPTGECVGVEHNESEAKALASFLNNRNGGGYSVIRNRPDQVRAAKEFYPRPDAARHPLRDQAFKATGLV